MPSVDDITWFKTEFKDEITNAIKGTPITIDLLTALACQETGEIWPVLRKKNLPTNKILELCVGDTIDNNGATGRKAFPKTKSDLISQPAGQEMFEIARKALVDMAVHIPAYRKVAQNPVKFCHGFGIFQYDLQFFKVNPQYFLKKRYAEFDACLNQCVAEIKNALRKLKYEKKLSLTDEEAAQVAIVYNTGTYRPNRGLKQGYKSSDGRYYGEQFFDFLRVSKSIHANTATPAAASEIGVALVASPQPITATGQFFEVDVVSDPLRLRREPKIDPQKPKSNVIASLPDGHIVRAVTGLVIKGFLEVETSLKGANFRGFAAAKYLKPHAGNSVEVEIPRPAPSTGIVAVYTPRKQSTVTKRVEIANALSLNEGNMPGRVGSSAGQLRAEIAAIIEWLAVDKPSHLRYQPRTGLTFCNIYAHDFCCLAGVYLPRVWWTQGAIADLAQGKKVEPLYGKTIDEQRANDLYRWLQDFGIAFGWRRAGTLDELQMEVNQGAVGAVVARRKIEGKSGHIAMVVPETELFRAKRSAEGKVISPLQSQAGATNFRYGTGRMNWWNDDLFAESAFWLHA
jgi:hypothetical protein